MFVDLHPQLKKDCILLCQTSVHWILLHRNALIPWFILVPKGLFQDLDDLDEKQRNRLFSLADKLSAILRSEYGAEKINIRSATFSAGSPSEPGLKRESIRLN